MSVKSDAETSRRDGDHYKLSWANHWVQGWPIVISSTVVIVCPAYFFLRFGGSSLKFGILGGVLGLLLILIPFLVLHVRYTNLSKGIVLKVDSQRISITYRSTTTVVGWDEVQSMEITETRSQMRGSLQWYPWDSYSFATIRLVDERTIVIPSLLAPRLDLPAGRISVQRRGVFYAWPPKAVALQVCGALKSS